MNKLTPAISDIFRMPASLVQAALRQMTDFEAAVCSLSCLEMRVGEIDGPADFRKSFVEWLKTTPYDWREATDVARDCYMLNGYWPWEEAVVQG